MIWLCQATVGRGRGASPWRILAVDHGWPVLVAVLIGGLVALPFGLMLGLLTIRMGDLYVALVTLTFGLLVREPRLQPADLSPKRRPRDQRQPVPTFASAAACFTYLCLAVFALAGDDRSLNLRRRPPARLMRCAGVRQGPRPSGSASCR